MRGSERIPIDTALTLYHGPSLKVCEGMCKDISTTGLGVVVDTVIPLGAECFVKIHDGRNRQTEYEAVIEIIRIFPLENDLFLLGCSIITRFDTAYFKL